MEAQAEQKQILQTAQAGAAEKTQGPEIMMIDPLTRAQDFKEAFTYLSLYKTGSLIYFELASHEKLYNILDLSLMKGGTLVIFKLNTTQGVKYRVVKTEMISSIGND